MNPRRGMPLAISEQELVTCPDSVQETPVSTALVPLDAPRCDSRAAASGGHARADFVAQLIATSEHSPQTRLRRRAPPDEAVAAYRTVKQSAPQPGRAFCRSI